mmetsp:Transcript_20394/g.28601  ORF Transcript_20394/g.28601 Transcript_20394/m.28601 type:complete len:262 (-) Transcript_20394:206-991(-)
MSRKQKIGSIVLEVLLGIVVAVVHLIQSNRLQHATSQLACHIRNVRRRVRDKQGCLVLAGTNISQHIKVLSHHCVLHGFFSSNSNGVCQVVNTFLQTFKNSFSLSSNTLSLQSFRLCFCFCLLNFHKFGSFSFEFSSFSQSFGFVDSVHGSLNTVLRFDISDQGINDGVTISSHRLCQIIFNFMRDLFFLQEKMIKIHGRNDTTKRVFHKTLNLRVRILHRVESCLNVLLNHNKLNCNVHNNEDVVFCLGFISDNKLSQFG